MYISLCIIHFDELIRIYFEFRTVLCDKKRITQPQIIHSLLIRFDLFQHFILSLLDLKERSQGRTVQHIQMILGGLRVNFSVYLFSILLFLKLIRVSNIWDFSYFLLRTHILIVMALLYVLFDHIIFLAGFD